MKVSDIVRTDRKFPPANLFGKAEPKAAAHHLISTPDTPEEE